VNYQFVISLLIVVAIAAALLLMRMFIFRVLHRLAQKTDNVIDDLLLEGLEGPSALLIIALALYISIRLSELPETYMVYAVKGM